ncbi:MAG: hypothetical protein A2653_00765 [Candidatus Zambryskibacteria bacterium RIFCSPHIGHO2_01_FULL_43_25]|uniref:VanZ-like domain-containing protein n=1 Tax=Candidatus Zambryskibacteria bacterium RIFCSPLOWO2_01_FULL_45_21 TaxID=1802761 RepID=A0A1G2U4L0_9BACT|nr:MAG: hypothetical protein A2653_00765 [Candidatus Zambryskibacteria bacterium RIFCSPHIGHO2_01_FULL_43_25]OHB00595.1 MAG: hypothetical protein A3E94_00445 [Candidatus Zambryskibacteria bacterium RIFCSPHIGHO2_12_FULL_44_12b]OHB04436.1 MAG: hypothetical protein A3B14_03290 [Candidatus Zambryskibacteria bacterium RIFCSPLOWO2_01_FULL_45_21]
MIHGLFFAPIVALLCIVGFLHLLALSESLYFIYGWLDLVVHFLSGIAIGVTFLWLYMKQALKNGQRKTFAKVLLVSIFTALLIASAWEVFEFKIGLTFTSNNYAFDTLTDILITVVGGLISAFYIRAIMRKELAV